MGERELSIPCPQCGEVGHKIEYIQEGLSIVCPSLPENVVIWLMPDGKILRDNRGQFKTKYKVSDSEFPEFTDALDFFDHTHEIEI